MSDMKTYTLEESLNIMSSSFALDAEAVNMTRSMYGIEEPINIMRSTYYQGGYTQLGVPRYRGLEEIEERILEGDKIKGLIETDCDGFVYFDEYGYLRYINHWGNMCLKYEYLLPHNNFKNLTKYNHLEIKLVMSNFYYNKIESLEGCPSSIIEINAHLPNLKDLMYCPPNLEIISGIYFGKTDLLLLPKSVKILVGFYPKDDNADYKTYSYYHREKYLKILDEMNTHGGSPSHGYRCIDEIHENNAARLRGMRTKSSRK